MRHAVAILLVALATPAHGGAYVETPMLAPLVAAGKLPPVAARLPQIPKIATLTSAQARLGRHGGTLHTLLPRPKDIRLMVAYGYARLVAFDEKFRLQPDIVERYTVERGRRFTFHLRKGHRWSDGHPFTSEDFRYYWEDVANHPELSPLGPPRVLVVNGEKAKVEFPDKWTVRYRWSQPNPAFLPRLAGTTPLYIYRPAHYLKRFHKRYAKPRRLARMVKKSRRRNWAALHNRRDNQYKNDNPKLPTLQPWVIRTKPPAQQFDFVRNPYYHRVDKAGRQLPYIDKVLVKIAHTQIIPPKTGAGESDLQARAIQFNNYTFLKESEKRHPQKVRLWRTAKGAHMALFPNLTANDPVWRRLFRDVRFRRALSLAVDRHEINQVIYFGLAIEGNNTMLPGSPLHSKDYQWRWARFDLARANRLLDNLGLDKRNDRGLRLLPDGRPMEIVVETAGESTEQADVLELVRDSWLKIGIKLFTRPSQRTVFRNRIFAGETLMSVWSGYENGLADADTLPNELAPTSQQQLQWPKWGQYFETRGRSGVAPDMPEARELLTLYRRWIDAGSTAARTRIWRRMLEIHADNVFSIGIVCGVLQPVVVSTRLKNVPEEGYYNWQPGAHFGVYRPDTFWIDPSAQRAGQGG